MVAETLTSAYAEAISILGNDPSRWAWGRIHRTNFTHPLLHLADAELAGRIVSLSVEEGVEIPEGEVVGYIDTVQLALQKQVYQLRHMFTKAGRSVHTADELLLLQERRPRHTNLGP